MGGVEEAALWVKVYDGSVRAVIMHKGKVTIYAKEMRYDYLPAQFRSYVRNLLDPGYEQEAPPNVRWRRWWPLEGRSESGRPSRLATLSPAGNRQHVPGDEPRRGRDEPARRLGDLLRKTDAAQRRHRLDSRAE